MNNIFSEIGAPAWDFIHISALFLLTMLTFLGVRDKKYFWLNYLLLLILVLQCLLVIWFRGGLPLKLFATLMLATTLIIEAVVGMRRKMGVAGRPAANSRT